MTGDIDPTKEVLARFRDDNREGRIHILNLVRLLDRAAYPDGRNATGAEANAAYGRDSAPEFMRLGGRAVWQGRFELMLIGPTDEPQHCDSRSRRRLRHRRIVGEQMDQRALDRGLPRRRGDLRAQ